MSKRALISLALGTASFLYFSYGRGYPFQLAVLMGAALMFLGWAALRTWDQLRGPR